MVKGVDSVSSSGHPGGGYAGGLASVAGNHRAKRDHPKQVCEDLTAAAQRGLKFHIHEDTGLLMVQVIAKEDGRVIREIPSEAFLDLEVRIDKMTGLLFSKDV